MFSLVGSVSSWFNHQSEETQKPNEETNMVDSEKTQTPNEEKANTQCDSLDCFFEQKLKDIREYKEQINKDLKEQEEVTRKFVEDMIKILGDAKQK